MSLYIPTLTPITKQLVPPHCIRHCLTLQLPRSSACGDSEVTSDSWGQMRTPPGPSGGCLAESEVAPKWDTRAELGKREMGDPRTWLRPLIVTPICYPDTKPQVEYPCTGVRFYTIQYCSSQWSLGFSHLRLPDRNLWACAPITLGSSTHAHTPPPRLPPRPLPLPASLGILEAWQ